MFWGPMHSVVQWNLDGDKPFLGAQDIMETFNTCIVVAMYLRLVLGSQIRCDILHRKKVVFRNLIRFLVRVISETRLRRDKSNEKFNFYLKRM